MNERETIRSIRRTAKQLLAEYLTDAENELSAYEDATELDLARDLALFFTAVASSLIRVRFGEDSEALQSFTSDLADVAR